MTIKRYYFRIWLWLFIPVIIAAVYYGFREDKKLRDELYAHIAINIGNEFSIETLVDVNRDTAILEYASDKTIIDFWFSNCPPCIAEQNQFENLIKGKEKEISVVSISVDKFLDWQKIYKENKSPFKFMNADLPNWRQLDLLPPDSPGHAIEYVSMLLSFSRYPGYFVLDRTGKILATPSSAVHYIKENIYNENAFVIYLKEQGLTTDTFKNILLALILFTGIFWPLIFVIIIISRYFSRKQ